LRLPVRAETEYELRCDLHVPSESGRCELSVDGATLAIAPHAGTHELHTRFTTARDAGCVEISWRAPAFVPRASLGTADDRPLAVVVRRVVLAERAAPRAAHPNGRVPLVTAHVSRDALRALARPLERGAVIWCPTLDPPVLAAALDQVVHEAHELLPGMRSAPRIDGELDGIWSTLFRDRVLLFNTTGETRTKELRLASVGGPDAIRVTLAPHDLGEVPLRR
jgi:hypothetical protein